MAGRHVADVPVLSAARIRRMTSSRFHDPTTGPTRLHVLRVEVDDHLWPEGPRAERPSQASPLELTLDPATGTCFPTPTASGGSPTATVGAAAWPPGRKYGGEQPPSWSMSTAQPATAAMNSCNSSSTCSPTNRSRCASGRRPWNESPRPSLQPVPQDRVDVLRERVF